MQLHPFRKTNMRAFENYLLSKYEMYTARERVRSVPYSLTVDASDHCQLMCPTCPTGIENAAKRAREDGYEVFRQERRMLTPELFASLLEEIGEEVFMIMFYNWGEPLLNKKLPALIKAAAEHEIFTEIHSNLSLPIPDERIDELLASGLSALKASVDGFSQEAYEKNRVGGNVELIKYNLERLVERRALLGVEVDITWQYLVFSFNEKEVDDAARFCKALGIHFNTRDAYLYDPTWLPSYRQHEAPQSVPERARNHASFERIWSPLSMPEGHPVAPTCGWHYGYSAITAGGSLMPCCMATRDEDDFGTMIPGETSFTDVWNNTEVQTVRSGFARYVKTGEKGDTLCSGCPYPPTMVQLYSLHDGLIMSRFRQLSEDETHPLHRAFDHLAHARYGRPLRDLAYEHIHSVTAERFMDFGEYPDDAARFVAFYETHLLEQGVTRPEQ